MEFVQGKIYFNFNANIHAFNCFDEGNVYLRGGSDALGIKLTTRPRAHPRAGISQERNMIFDVACIPHV